MKKRSTICTVIKACKYGAPFVKEVPRSQMRGMKLLLQVVVKETKLAVHRKLCMTGLLSLRLLLLHT